MPFFKFIAPSSKLSEELVLVADLAGFPMVCVCVCVCVGGGGGGGVGGVVGGVPPIGPNFFDTPMKLAVPHWSPPT